MRENVCLREEGCIGRERKVSPEGGREESMEDVEHKNEKATRALIDRTPEQEMCNRKKLKYNLVKTRKKKRKGKGMENQDEQENQNEARRRL